MRVCGRAEVGLFLETLKTEMSLKHQLSAVAGLMLCQTAAQSTAGDLIAVFNQSPPAPLKKNIIFALGAFENRSADIVSFLAKVSLSEPDGPTRRAAAECLARWRVTAECNPLDKLLLRPAKSPADVSQLLQIIRSSATSELDDISAISSTAQQLITDRQLALRALAKPARMAPLATLYHEMLNDPNSTVRDVAAFALSKAKDISAMGAIRRNLSTIKAGKWEVFTLSSVAAYRLGLNITALNELGDCGWVQDLESFPDLAPSWPTVLAPCKKEAEPIIRKSLKSAESYLAEFAKRACLELYKSECMP